MTTETPIYPLSAHERQKKRRIDLEFSPTNATEFNRAAEVLVKNENLPLYASTIIAYLLEGRKQLDDVLTRNRELTTENKVMSEELIPLRAENSNLREAIARSTPLPSQSHSQHVPISDNNESSCFEEHERRRTVVIIGVPQCRDRNRFNRI
ncbi:hypothetical protein Y032_0039g123 [Ancylostoma ceylanicum]|uniref:Uncharacterized protein n=1 Tax=Ancylostoma ceylanicum TaxID=53326 RepID=A0A016UJI9_9BILA|nr:hypothetical protein Y032_0039g123 [Ancylostoma ceylanicum]